MPNQLTHNSYGKSAVRLTKVFGSDSVQRDQQVVVRAKLNMITSRCGAVENHRGEVFSVSRAQILNETV